MKKFTFPLGRVMDWRAMIARVEESKLEQMYGELRAIDARMAALDREREQSERAVLAKAVSTGMELASLDTFRRFVFEERIRLERTRAEVQQRITAQIQVVANKRRDVKLLQRLKDDRFESWQKDFAREIDGQAEESFLAKRNRNFGR
jgi:flagellar biosynthesis chaperone FliJ